MDDQNAPNVTNNPLPAQNNLMGMICDDQEYKLLGKMGKLFRKVGEEDNSINSSEPVASLSVEGVNLDTKVLCVPGISKGIEVRAGNQGSSGLRYKQSKRNEDKAKNHKRIDWALPQLIPHISHSFIKPQGPEMEAFFIHKDIKEVIQDLNQLFCEVYMSKLGKVQVMPMCSSWAQVLS
ncbi:hypothetical protein H5410_014332 [Solanum commersonii]|uniref:Uncharacterized protein n=1 Tax=Solanum commersonii TaxID=4109 RepID=A0A9J5ZR31_SOLCO|nr:hypothetical protein H5410_014332 [Solanum commersonii]